jgi:MscS family membrane protein
MNIAWKSSALHRVTWLNDIPTHYLVGLEAIISLAIALIISLTLYIVYWRLVPRLEKSHRVWDDAFVRAIHMPLQFLTWILGVTYSIAAFGGSFPKMNIMRTADNTRSITLIIVIIWCVLRFIRLLEVELLKADTTQKGRRFNKAKAFAIGRLLRIIVAILGILILLQAVGVPISTLIAFGGAGTLIIGFGAKDIVANFFGGLMVYTDRPFSVGDWISSPDRNIEGTVEAIGWRLTRVRTFDRRPLYIPNATFLTVSVLNPSRMLNRRITATIGVRYADAANLRPIRDDITAMLKNHAGIDTQQTLFVRLSELGDSSINFQIYTFTKTTDWLQFLAIQEEVLLNIIDIITQHGAQIAFPTRTLEIAQDIPFRVTSENKVNI